MIWHLTLGLIGLHQFTVIIFLKFEKNLTKKKSSGIKDINSKLTLDAMQAILAVFVIIYRRLQEFSQMNGM